MIREILQNRQEIRYQKARNLARRKIARGAATDSAAIQEHEQNVNRYHVLRDFDFFIAGANILASVITHVNPSSTEGFRYFMASQFQINGKTLDIFSAHPAIALGLTGILGTVVALYNGHKAVQERAFVEEAYNHNYFSH